MNDAERKFFEAAQPSATSWFWIGVKFGLGFFTAAFLFGCISVFVWVVFLASLLVGGAAHQTTKASPPAAVAPAAPMPTTPTLTLATPPAPASAIAEEPARDESPETPPAPPTDFPMGESSIPSAASTDAPKEAPPAPTTPTPARGNGKIVQIPDDKRRAIIEMHNQQNAQRRSAGLPPLPMQAAPLPRGTR